MAERRQRTWWWSKARALAVSNFYQGSAAERFELHLGPRPNPDISASARTDQSRNISHRGPRPTSRRLPGNRDAQDPTFGAIVVDDQIQTISIGVPARFFGPAELCPVAFSCACTGVCFPRPAAYFLRPPVPELPQPVFLEIGRSLTRGHTPLILLLSAGPGATLTNVAIVEMVSLVHF